MLVSTKETIKKQTSTSEIHEITYDMKLYGRKEERNKKKKREY